jgi:hypothetical protein
VLIYKVKMKNSEKHSIWEKKNYEKKNIIKINYLKSQQLSCNIKVVVPFVGEKEGKMRCWPQRLKKWTNSKPLLYHLMRSKIITNN